MNTQPYYRYSNNVYTKLMPAKVPLVKKDKITEINGSSWSKRPNYEKAVDIELNANHKCIDSGFVLCWSEKKIRDGLATDLPWLRSKWALSTLSQSHQEKKNIHSLYSLPNTQIPIGLVLFFCLNLLCIHLSILAVSGGLGTTVL